MDSHIIIMLDDINSYGNNFSTRNRRNSYISTVRLIISYCKELMTNNVECSIVFAKRSTNRATHLLARATGSMLETGEWDLSPPELLRVVLLFDMTK